MKKKLLTTTLIIATLGVLYALSQGANYPSTVVDDASVGSCAWTNPMNATSSDTIYAYNNCNTNFGAAPIDYRVSIIKSNGAIGATNEATSTAWPTGSEAYVSYGSPTDLWGETWTNTDINSSNFGLAISVTASSLITHYLETTNYGFTIPNGSTINGIVVEIQKLRTGGSLPGYQANIDTVRITVYYTAANGTQNLQIKTGKLSILNGKFIIH